MLDHVIDACLWAEKFTNRNGHVEVTTKVLVPIGDTIIQDFSDSCDMWEGPEDDVLTRYVEAARAAKAEFIVRVTGDCPLLPAHVVSKHINLALANNYDYLSNVDEECRMALDGIDCEVISAKLLTWLNETATSVRDREHVTTLARREPPEWAKRGIVQGYFDLSPLKLSVDTEQDLENVRKWFSEARAKVSQSFRKYDRRSVHRYF